MSAVRHALRSRAMATGDGRWLKENLAEAEALEHSRIGKGYLFGETMPRDRYRDVGVNVRVLEPGQPASQYHSEAAEEFFIVLGGECLAIVDDEEVPLRKWDFIWRSKVGAAGFEPA